MHIDNPNHVRRAPLSLYDAKMTIPRIPDLPDQPLSVESAPPRRTSMKQKVKRNSVNSTIYDRPSKADTGLELPQSFAAKMTTAEELQTQVNALQAEASMLRQYVLASYLTNASQLNASATLPGQQVPYLSAMPFGSMPSQSLDSLPMHAGVAQTPVQMQFAPAVSGPVVHGMPGPFGIPSEPLAPSIPTSIPGSVSSHRARTVSESRATKDAKLKSKGRRGSLPAIASYQSIQPAYQPTSFTPMLGISTSTPQSNVTISQPDFYGASMATMSTSFPNQQPVGSFTAQAPLPTSYGVNSAAVTQAMLLAASLPSMPLPHLDASASAAQQQSNAATAKLSALRAKKTNVKGSAKS